MSDSVKQKFFGAVKSVNQKVKDLMEESTSPRPTPKSTPKTTPRPSPSVSPGVQMMRKSEKLPDDEIRGEKWN